MTAQRSNDSDGAEAMSARAWGLHAVAALSDPDARRQLAAPAHQPFATARQHVLCDVDAPQANAGALEARMDGDRAPRHRRTAVVAIAAPRPCGEPAQGAVEAPSWMGGASNLEGVRGIDQPRSDSQLFFRRAKSADPPLTPTFPAQIER